MYISFGQILIIILIFIIFGTLIAIVNLNAKRKSPANKEQVTWQKIETLNTKKKELLEQKNELSYKYTAKNVDEHTYTKTLKEITTELKKIEDEINVEVSKLTTYDKKENLEDELRFKNLKIKGNLNEIVVENKNLKEKISELEEFIKNISKQESKKPTEEDVNKIKFYSMIINRYKDTINQNERKTISEIKDMVKPTDLTIKSITSKFTPIGYDFKKDYISSIRKVYNYLRTEINVVKNDLKVLFWVDFSKAIKEKTCDEQTTAIMLCSCMRALNDEFASVDVVLLEDETIHSFVSTKVKETYYIFDIAQNIPFDTYRNINADTLYSEYRFNNKKIIRKIYSFNNIDYLDYNQK